MEVAPRIKLDLNELGNSYTVKADIPGVHGILELTLPKKAATSTERLSVQ